MLFCSEGAWPIPSQQKECGLLKGDLVRYGHSDGETLYYIKKALLTPAPATADQSETLCVVTDDRPDIEMHLMHTIPGPDPGACPDCGGWRKAGMQHSCGREREERESWWRKVFDAGGILLAGD